MLRGKDTEVLRFLKVSFALFLTYMYLCTRTYMFITAPLTSRDIDFTSVCAVAALCQACFGWLVRQWRARELPVGAYFFNELIN